MESYSETRKWVMHTICACLTVATISLLCGCEGSNSSSTAQDTPYGSVALGLQFESTDALERSADRARTATAPDICPDLDIDTINVQIFRPNGQPVADVTWDCSEHGGIICQAAAGQHHNTGCWSRHGQ